MNRHTNPFAQGAATGAILVLLVLSVTLVRGAPAAGQAVTPQAVIIITATPTIGLPLAVDIPAPTAVPLAVESPTAVPPLAAEPVQVENVAPPIEAPVVQIVTPPTPAPAPTVQHIKLDGYVELERPPHRPFDQPIYSANPIHGAPEPARQP